MIFSHDFYLYSCVNIDDMHVQRLRCSVTTEFTAPKILYHLRLVPVRSPGNLGIIRPRVCTVLYCVMAPCIATFRGRGRDKDDQRKEMIVVGLGWVGYKLLPQENLRGELGGDGAGETVDAGRISDVFSPVLNRSLAGGDGLDVESEHGEHSETAVLDLLDLELSEGIRIVSKAKRVEGSSRVDGIKTLSSRSAVHTVGLSTAHKDDLGSEDGKDGLSVDEGRVAEVVKTALSEDLGSGLEPDRLGDRDTGVLGEELRGDASESTKHSPASVDHLGLTVGGEGGRISGKTLGIPSVVSRELTGEVGRDGTLGERAEPESTVRTVPFLAGGTADALAGNAGGDLVHGHTLLLELVGHGAHLNKGGLVRGGVEEGAALGGGDAGVGDLGNTGDGLLDRGLGDHGGLKLRSRGEGHVADGADKHDIGGNRSGEAVLLHVVALRGGVEESGVHGPRRMRYACRRALVY
mmetsp:Transcript_10988/g.21824  ORF Transcript_10988/g.21824 Transcript_10988/m.21824 type:complete len:464 (-) Transcript_10988:80-1471(-)